jgi:hypothetical protein
LAGAGAALGVAGIAGCGTAALGARRRTLPPGLQLAPLRASTDRITQITV